MRIRIETSMRLALLLVTVTLAAPASAVVVDQSNLTSTGNFGVGPSQNVGQSFVVATSGLLTGIEFAPLLDSASLGDMVTIEVFNSLSQSLGTASITVNAFPPGGGVVPAPLSLATTGSGFFSLTGLGILVSASDTLSFRLSKLSGGSIRAGISANVYAAGTSIVNGTPDLSIDLAFKVLIAASNIDLRSGTTGSFLLGQSFNETRTASITVLGAGNLPISAMTLHGLIPSGTASVGARIYDTLTQTLIASAATTTSTSPVTVPINAVLIVGRSYRVGFFVQNASGNLFDPNPAGAGGFGYTDASGSVQVNGGFQGVADAYPTGASFSTIPQVVLHSGPDTDGDGIQDPIDNCRLTANPLQQDANLDGFGNICDADINNSGTVTTADFGLLRARLGTAPGPSGLACAGTIPCPAP